MSTDYMFLVVEVPSIKMQRTPRQVTIKRCHIYNKIIADVANPTDVLFQACFDGSSHTFFSNSQLEERYGAAFASNILSRSQSSGSGHGADDNDLQSFGCTRRSPPVIGCER